MTFRRVGSSYVIRLFKGEEINETLTAFLKKFGITAGSLSAIGAVNSVTIGFFDAKKKEYVKKDFEEDFEILSLTGNISVLSGEPFPHLHIILGDKSCNVRGGHLFKAVISLTCEIYLQAQDTIIEREFDPQTGMKFLKL